MRGWLRDVLTRIHALARDRSVRFTHKALRELEDLELGLDQDDCCGILEDLTVADSDGRIRSAITGEWMYVFKPTVSKTLVYVKLIVRRDCIVVSFHEEGIVDDA